MTLPVSGEQHDKAIEAAVARKRPDFAINHLMDAALRKNVEATLTAYFESLAEQGVVVVAQPDVVVVEQPDYIEWWDEPSTNSRWYRHVGCDGGSSSYMVPLDDCPPPSEDDRECANCCLVRPLRARGGRCSGTGRARMVDVAEVIAALRAVESDSKALALWAAWFIERRFASEDAA